MPSRRHSTGEDVWLKKSAPLKPDRRQIVAESIGESAAGSEPLTRRPQTTNRPSSCRVSPSTVILPPRRRSQIMSQWIAESLTPPVSG